MAKQLKVLMPPSFQKLRISDDLAGCFDAAGGRSGCGKCSGAGDEGTQGPTTALVVGPFGKVWRVEVGRDDDGPFLGRGWAEFLAAHGVGVGWFVVLRHEGGQALSVKAFDTSFCIMELGVPAAVMTSRSSKGVSCKPQFIRVIHQDLMDKMMIPAKFVEHYVTEEYLNRAMAIVFSPLGKFWRIDLQNDQSGVFFSGSWSQFVAFHGISAGEILLFRYEGNMVFKFKVFGPNGCPRDFKQSRNAVAEQNTMKQESPSEVKKRKADDEKASSKEKKRAKRSMTPLNKQSPHNTPDEKASSKEKKRAKRSMTHLNKESPHNTPDEKASSKEKKMAKRSMTHLNKESPHNTPGYQIGPPAWIKKEVTKYMLQKLLSLSLKFCHSIGFRNACTITLKTEMDSTRSWEVRGVAYEKICYVLGEGWNRFCKENKLKEGDLCTFNVIQTTLWHVVITRSPKLMEIKKVNESLCSSNMEPKSSNHCTNSEDEEQVRQKGSIVSLSKASSYSRSAYEIGPPSWIKKEIKAYCLENYLFLAPGFCNAIGLREQCTITLTSSTSRTSSWQIRGVKQRNGNYFLGSGWKKFSQDNSLKIGDVCTFNVIETELWHVVVTRGLPRAE